MSHHHTDIVSGLLDGQLTGVRLWLAKRHVSVCPVCATEYRRQRRVREMLHENPPTAAMSDSPEFFWATVKAEIQRRGAERVEAPIPKLGFADWLEQHQFAVVSVAALLVAAAGILAFALAYHGTRPVVAAAPTPVQIAQVEQSKTPIPGANAATPDSFAQVEQLKTPIPDTAATAFESEDAGVTVIWVTGLPWTPDMDEMKTEFANLDT
jgi:hypothetical protein